MRCVDNTFKVSSAFAEACQSQFEILADYIPKLSRAAVFVRSENAESGELEMIRWSWPEAQRVFVVGPEDAPKAPMKTPSLPGGMAASDYLPNYPFCHRAAWGSKRVADGGRRALRAARVQDGHAWCSCAME